MVDKLRGSSFDNTSKILQVIKKFVKESKDIKDTPL